MRRLLTREKKSMSFESNTESHKARDGACAVSLPAIFSCHGDGALFESWPLWGGQTFKKKNKKKIKKKKK